MKKVFVILGAASLVVFAACNKEQTLPQEHKTLSITATVEQHENPNATKTALDGSSVVWAAGDAVKVFDEAGKTGKLTADAAGSSVHFTQVGDLEDGFNEAGTIYAFYPHDAATSASGSTITFTLPATQYYVANSFDPACNVAVGQLSAGAVSFKNAFGLLKLNLVGNMKVSRIELVGNNDEKMNGTFTVDASVTSAAVASGAPTTAEKKTTLDCCTNYANEGVNLDPDTPTAFYFVVPAGAFGDSSNGGFTATVYDWSGDSYNIVLATTKNSNVIVRTRVRAMDNATANLTVPSGYTLKKWLRSTIHYVEGEKLEMACIDTGVAGGNDNLAIDCVFEYEGFAIWRGFYGNYPTELAETEGNDPEDYAVTRLLLSDNSSSPQLGLYINSKALQSNSGATWKWSPMKENTRYCSLNTKSKAALDGKLATRTPQAGVYPNNTNIAAFMGRVIDGKKLSVATSTRDCTITLYSLRIKDNGTSERLFIPCVRDLDGEAGFWELEEGKFYGNMNIDESTEPDTVYGSLSTN